MTMLDQLEIEPEVVQELRSQYVLSVEDLVAMAAQPDERAALLEDMKWTEPRLQRLIEKARRVLPKLIERQAANGAC